MAELSDRDRKWLLENGFNWESPDVGFVVKVTPAALMWLLNYAAATNQKPDITTDGLRNLARLPTPPGALHPLAMKVVSLPVDDNSRYGFLVVYLVHKPPLKIFTSFKQSGETPNAMNDPFGHFALHASEFFKCQEAKDDGLLYRPLILVLSPEQEEQLLAGNILFTDSEKTYWGESLHIRQNVVNYGKESSVVTTGVNNGHIVAEAGREYSGPAVGGRELRLCQFVQWWMQSRDQEDQVWLEKQIERAVPEYGEWKRGQGT